MSRLSVGINPTSTALSGNLQSKQSVRVTFPQAVITSSKSAIVALGEDRPEINPFRVPCNQDVFMLRDKERQRKQEQRDKQRKLQIHEKTTYTSRVNATTSTMRKTILDDADNTDAMQDLSVKDDTGWLLTVSRDRNIEKENLVEYVNKKRETFLVQYSLQVKRDEMKKLEELALAEERKLERAERFLEEDAAMFDEFLKENDKNSVEAIKVAEAETKSKLEKVAEIKKNNTVMVAIRSDISKYEETLREYMQFKDFLERLTPIEWKEEKLVKREEKNRLKREASQASRSSNVTNEKKSPTPPPPKKEPENRSSNRQSAHARQRSNMVKNVITSGRKQLVAQKSTVEPEPSKYIEVVVDDNDSDDDPELYFSEPAQLLVIFQELEEHNLSLITNSQETEEAMEELKNTIRMTKDKMNRETDMLKSQITLLKSTIKREEEKADDLELKCRMFSFGEFKAEDQDKTLRILNRKVEEVYRGCIGDNEANISTLQMLTNIENRLEDLFENIEVMPPELVEAAEKAKEKERRMRLREEKLAAQRAYQEERVRKALERAKADPKKKVGKRLVFRSEPPQRIRREGKKKDGKEREEEEKHLFFD